MRYKIGDKIEIVPKKELIRLCKVDLDNIPDNEKSLYDKSGRVFSFVEEGDKEIEKLNNGRIVTIKDIVDHGSWKSYNSLELDMFYYIEESMVKGLEIVNPIISRFDILDL